ncbi:hypothetical protein C7T94_00895 [Pedobacter yulinensis]|uniref:Outer membrane protein beta-barrel domain-containing protein n=1 Tax=Pedobacter yulinensis TaxID=2126353 RepID=A0A2T3HQK2_9SPHI|nr:hypothetical protein [Pedobacter yulinensis]PST84722.1 hypothetical protein C7T94_00895 [Pedobacter yulinensis]
MQNDHQFDKALRKKVDESEPRFEEAAWAKMEEKLDRHDRRVLFRRLTYAAAAVLLLGLLTWLLYPATAPHKAPAKDYTRGDQPQHPVRQPGGDTLQHSGLSDQTASRRSAQPAPRSGHVRPHKTAHTAYSGPVQHAPVSRSDKTMPASHYAARPQQQPPAETPAAPSTNFTPAQPEIPRPAPRRGLPLSLAFSAGPDFSSTSHLVGGRANISAGMLLGVNVGKRLTISTGARIGLKRYDATGLQYKTADMQRMSTVSGIDASCNVLEIPLQASYAIVDQPTRRLEINAGLSSYLMLKETYRFDYTEASGYKPYTLIKNNANQHPFSVVHVSAAYYVDIPRTAFQLGLEPYMKVPLQGVGEGKVHLKSSGVALNLRMPLGTR